MEASPLIIVQPTESVRRRYAVTLFTQFVQLAASVATAGVVPRALGPALFGSYNFLFTTASTIRGFFDPSADQAFFTFSSQNRRSGSLTKLYALILLGQIVMIFSMIGVMALTRSTGWLWPGQPIDKIIWVTIFEWTLFVTAILRQLGDSKGLTVRAQILTLMTAFINVTGLLGLNALGYLNFYTYVWLNLFTAVLIGFILGYWLLVINRDLCWTGGLHTHAKEYIQRWWQFASPLILLEYYRPLVAYTSTYLLQRWYGSVEQGYFALALKWSAFILVFTSSALSIFWREIANTVANGEHERAARTYLKFTYLLFFLAMVLCTWLSLSSHYLIQILVGSEYRSAIPVLALMAYYPLQQTYGQINTAVLKGMEQTRIVRNLGIIVSIPDLLLSYFLLASRSAPIPGFELGSIGIALRMVLFGLLFVQAYEWMSHRAFGLSYLKTLMRKTGIAVIVLICASLTLVLFGSFLADGGIPIILVFVTSSFAFFTAVGIIILLWPELMGINRAELLDNINKVRSTVLKIVGR